MSGMWIKKWSRIQASACHKVLYGSANSTAFRAESASFSSIIRLGLAYSGYRIPLISTGTVASCCSVRTGNTYSIIFLLDYLF